MTNKKKQRLLFRTIVLLVLVGAVIFALVSNLTEKKEIVKVDDIAPNFALKQVNGDESVLKLSDFEGKGIMLNFWATYCKPCEDEMPYMQELYPVYKEKGVEIVAVSLDATQLVIDRFIDKYNLTFPVLHDTTGEIMDLYSVGQLPSTLFIDSEGKVVRKVNQELNLEQLDNYLAEITPEEE